MKEITDILTDLLTVLRGEILEYYQKSYSYLKVLIAYKKIDLNKKTEKESEKNLKDTLEKILKAIKTGLNTIGVSMDILNENQNNFINSISKARAEFSDYNSYFEAYLKNYVNKILFEILIEYLLNIDIKKLENVILFDLLPSDFIAKLNEFKKKHFSDPNNIKIYQQQDYNSSINFTDLTFIPKKISEPDLLTQLQEAKQDIIETLKTSKKDLLKSSIVRLDEKMISKKITPQFISPPEKDQEVPIEINSDTFLDYFGHFSPIRPEMVNRFKIDKVSLINSKVVNQDLFDLEDLFYFISIIKMLNLEFPFTENEILGILKSFIKGKVFSSSKDNIPDSKNIFFGLAVLSELDLLNKIEIIDLIEIENFIKSELKEFIPEKLSFNLYSLLCLKLLAIRQNIILNRNSILRLIFNLNLLNLEEFNPVLDIYNYLATIKLLDKNSNLNQFKTRYINELKKLITLNGSINDLITDSARSLLILDLFNLKEQESELCNSLLNFILNSTSFFDVEKLDSDFNWRKDILGYKIELKMLFWSLLASSLYAHMDF